MGLQIGSCAGDLRQDWPCIELGMCVQVSLDIVRICVVVN
jgi:hypothetical protein